MRKRVYGKRARSQSAKRVGVKKQRYASVMPRFRTLKDNSHSSRAQFTRTSLTYCEHGITVDPGIASAGVYVFAANGLYDPNHTGVGHQPAGFDQYMALYNEYLVVGSTITVWFTATNESEICNVGVFLEDFSATDLDWRRYVENGNGNYTILDAYKTGGGNKKVTHKADISKFSTQDITNDDGFVGTSSKNPDDTHYYHCVVAPMDSTSNVQAIFLNVEIRYDVIFRDPALTALS